MASIPIYPPIKVITIKLSDELELVECLELFDYQYYNFEFMLDNQGLQITSTDISIYVYKNDEYKILLEEIKIIPSNTKHSKLSYKYLHKKIYKKIEFKIFYKYSEEKLEGEEENKVNKEVKGEYKYNLKPFVIIQKSI